MIEECSDGVDNDGDGFVDFPADPGCKNATSLSERTQCQDGVDNDGQSGIDFDGGASVNGGVPIAGVDPQCAGKPWRNSEAPSGGCGLGAELALALALARSVARRSTQARAI
jgi:hypothetical protein